MLGGGRNANPFSSAVKASASTMMKLEVLEHGLTLSRLFELEHLKHMSLLRRGRGCSHVIGHAEKGSTDNFLLSRSRSRSSSGTQVDRPSSIHTAIHRAQTTPTSTIMAVQYPAPRFSARKANLLHSLQSHPSIPDRCCKACTSHLSVARTAESLLIV